MMMATLSENEFILIKFFRQMFSLRLGSFFLLLCFFIRFSSRNPERDLPFRKFDSSVVRVSRSCLTFLFRLRTREGREKCSGN